MPSLTRRALLAGGAALAGAALLPSTAGASQTPHPWRGGRIWIVGAGSLSLHLQHAFGPIADLEPRLADSLADCTLATHDVALLAIRPPPAPLPDRAFSAELASTVQQLRDAGVLPVLLGLDAPGSFAEAWSGQLATHATAVGVPLVDLNTFDLSVDAARTAAGPAALAEGVVRRIGLYLPLRERGVPCLRTPLSLQSAACQRPMHAVAYVPDAAHDAPLPVLYLLHGAWGAWSDWSLANHEGLVDAALRHRMIVVCPDGLPFGWYLDSPLVPQSQVRTHLIEELLPLVDRTLPSNGVRSIGGLSMGGHGAFLLALTHEGLFRSASSMSGAIDICHVPKSRQITRLLGPYADNEAAWVAHSAARQLLARQDVARRLPMRLTCGTEDIWFQTNREVHEGLKKRDIEHIWEETPGAGHTWAYWTEQLPRHAAWHAPFLHAAAPPPPAPQSPESP